LFKDVLMLLMPRNSMLQRGELRQLAIVTQLLQPKEDTLMC
jgi:hypothetical protein